MSSFIKETGNNVVVYNGDCFDCLQDIKNESIDLIFADPPYNIGKKFGNFIDTWPSDKAYVEWCYKWMDLCIQKLKPSGSFYVMTSTEAMPYLDLWLRERLTILARIVWYYDSSGVQAKKYFGSLYEPIIFCVKDAKNYTFNSADIEVEAKTGSQRKLIDYRKKTPTLYKTTKIPGNVWYIPRVRYRMPEYEEHPSQKPEALLERIIKASSSQGNVVLDPFAGTFTTCAVAQRFKRTAIGIEMQTEYFKTGLRRLGIANSFNGEVIESLKRPFVVRNKNGVHNKIDAPQDGLFDAQM